MNVKSNRLGDIRSYYRRVLYEFYEEQEGDSLLFMLLKEYTGYSKAKIISSPNDTVSESQLLKIHFGIKALKNYKPIQYINGKAEFYGLEMIVNPQVLIPRPETEELVNWVIKDQNGKLGVSVLDIGTGTGCIAISLKKNFPEATVTALDFSFDALEVAQINAEINQVLIEFIQADMLSEKNWKRLGMFDVIISNPPYVRKMERKKMKKNVLDFEPGTALFVEDDDPLLFYEKIALFATDHLTSDGIVYCEINQYLGKETVQLFESKGFRKVELRKDFKGNERMLKAER